LDFKEGKYEYMLATDLASRGLDIKEVKTVVNFELPVQLTRYIHRIGRTARAGNIGTSVTLCNDNECLELKKMSRKTGDQLFKLNVKEETLKKSLR
jgi:superfamily II DNA/RNA helicase